MLKTKLTYMALGAVIVINLMSCTLPTGPDPVIVNRYWAEVKLGSEQLYKNPQLAIEYFTSAIEKELNYPQAFWRRGRVWLELKQYALAVQDFNRGFEAKLNFLGIEKTIPYIWFYCAQANIGFLTTINADKEDERTEIIKRITVDITAAEEGAGIVGDHDLIKDIVEFKHLHLNTSQSIKSEGHPQKP